MLPIILSPNYAALMGGGAADGGAAYQALVLTTNPLAYWPLDDKSGTMARDASGNNRIGTYDPTVVTLAQPGLLGTAAQFANISQSQYGLVGGANIIGALDMREYSVAFLWKPHTYAISNPKIMELWNASDYYSAYELRNNNNISVYLKEASGLQTLNTTEHLLNKVIDDAWMLLVLFNSESTGNSGVYFNKEFAPMVRLLGGLTTTTATHQFNLFAAIQGYVQHVIFWNRLITQADVNALYNAAFGAEPTWSGIYTLNDVFTTTQAAPLTSPRTCEPGPGTLTITDTGNNMTIASNQIAWSAKATNDVDPRAIGGAVTAPQVGVALIGTFASGRMHIGWDSVNTQSPQKSAFFPVGTSLYADLRPSGEPKVATITSGGVYNFALVQRRLGTLYFIKGGVEFPNWTLLIRTVANPTAFYPGFGASSTNVASAVSKFKLTTLPSPFNSMWGLALSTLLGKRAINDTFTHPVACFIEFLVVKNVSSGIIDFRFRIQDATNYWQITVNSSKNITLNEVVNGTPTQRAQNTSGIDVPQICICSSGSTIAVYISASSGIWIISYASATNFQTSTDGKLADVSDGVVSDIVVWPITVPAAAAAILDAALG